MDFDFGYQKIDAESLIDQLIEKDMIAITAACMEVYKSSNLFIEDELLNKDQNFVCPEDGFLDQLILLQKTPLYFRIITNFSAVKFSELSD